MSLPSLVGRPPRDSESGIDELRAALRSWQWRLVRAELARASVRGACAGLLTATVIVGLSWLTPLEQMVVRSPALGCGAVVWLAWVGRAFWPLRTASAVSRLDADLNLFDRLSTAWAYRGDTQPTALIQRRDALHALRGSTDRPLRDRCPRARQVAVLVVCLLVALAAVLLVSPRRPLLEAQAAEDAAMHQQAERLATVRQNAAALAARLTPETARQVQAILDEAAAGMQSARGRHEAASILARAEAQLSGALTDPAAGARDEALAAMSEALASEPLTRGLATALLHEDLAATRDALRALDQTASTLSDAQRQDVSHALQRAANVGHGQPASATALNQAAQAFGARPAAAHNESPQALWPPGVAEPNQSAARAAELSAALGAAAGALDQALTASRAQADLRALVHDLRPDADAAARPLSTTAQQPSGSRDTANTTAAGTTLTSRDAATTTTDTGRGAGVSPAATETTAQEVPAGEPSGEKVFIPGRPGGGPTGQSAPVDEVFQIRGVPRPYREALIDYAPSQRDYIDRADVPPAVRDLVRQYFVDLQTGQ